MNTSEQPITKELRQIVFTALRKLCREYKAHEDTGGFSADDISNIAQGLFWDSELINRICMDLYDDNLISCRDAAEADQNWPCHWTITGNEEGRAGL